MLVEVRKKDKILCFFVVVFFIFTLSKHNYQSGYNGSLVFMKTFKVAFLQKKITLGFDHCSNATTVATSW